MSALKLILGLIALVWAGIAAFLYFTQGSLLYQPRAASPIAETQLMNALPGVEVFLVVTPDGQSLTGWYLPRKHGRGLAPPLVYFCGNAEEATDFMKEQGNSYPDVSLVAVDYRGYGRSTGVPSEKDLKADALTIYDQAVATTGSLGFVMGRSLGAGIAAYVAANREVLGAILGTPFDSLVAVAKGHYPFLPVSWLLKEDYDALPDAAKAMAPALMLTGTQDDVIPVERGRALYDAWKGPKSYVNVLSAGHEDIEQYSGYKDSIPRFIQGNLR